MPEPFLVLATQNPIESDGTYPLPEAQLDRFMLKVVVDYPSYDDELVVVQRVTRGAIELRRVLSPERSPTCSGASTVLRRPARDRVRRHARPATRKPTRTACRT